MTHTNGFDMQLLEKYIIEHSKDVITRLASSWSDDDFYDLRATLRDLDAVSLSENEPAHDAPKVECVNTLTRKKKGQHVLTYDVCERLFSIFLSAGTNLITVTPDQLDLTLPQLKKLASRINYCSYKRRHHPNCRIRYRCTYRGVDFEFLREESANDRNQSIYA